MKAMENGVFGVIKLISKSKEGQAVVNINQISELDQYQEAHYVHGIQITILVDVFQMQH